MPFTLAHAAAVVPLARRWPRLGAVPLAIGAWVPDYEYFLLQTTRETQHSARGLFVFCLPLGLLTLWAWERGVGAAVVSLAPDAVRGRLVAALARGAGRPAGWGGAAGWGWASLAILLGAATHVVWDSATHRGGAVVRAWPALDATVVQLGDWPLRVYSLLQHGSSVVGLVVLAWVARGWLAGEAARAAGGGDGAGVVAQVDRDGRFAPEGAVARVDHGGRIVPEGAVARVDRSGRFVPAGAVSRVDRDGRFVPAGAGGDAASRVPRVPRGVRWRALVGIGAGAALVGVTAGAWAARDLSGVHCLAGFVVHTAIAAIPAAAAGVGVWALYARRFTTDRRGEA